MLAFILCSEIASFIQIPKGKCLMLTCSVGLVIFGIGFWRTSELNGYSSTLFYFKYTVFCHPDEDYYIRGTAPFYICWLRFSYSTAVSTIKRACGEHSSLLYVYLVHFKCCSCPLKRASGTTAPVY